ncbi:alkaline phosphatase family protein [Streptosporangium carneum]|uniref:Nucleotide pyrophosphatase n=1 Tax=Streptosporangium carneum TaxID=47481 RepID=A0A9W6I2W8_9ACTN|nr:alkaline phosphatase family protein [Streptosporangium carneum]GLK10193.1 hypothetical protein GCM10017600_35990 [Streptosporangium carneum]
MRFRNGLALLAAATVIATPLAAEARTAQTPLQAENFDGLSGSLSTRVDESGIPADLKGFTHTPPAGWTVSLAPDMPQGVTEWQGWSFTTLPFWTAAEGQGREGFTRASGVFAVADPDEWDDKGSPSSKGRFDSTLTSNEVTLPQGKDKVYLGFASHYRREAPQKGQVTVSFDGGAPVEIMKLGDADALNEYYSLEIPVPAGAQRMKVNWRLHDGANNWFWAIDDVRVADAPIEKPPLPEAPPEVPDGPDGTKKDKLLVIGLDGALLDKIGEADAPNLKELVAKGTAAPSPLYSSPMAQTSSGPGWSTIATGVWPDKHNVRDNDFTSPRYDAYPDFMTRLEKADPSFSTFVVASWGPINNTVFGAKVDVRLNGGADYDEGTTRKAVSYIKDNSPDATFVQLDNIDGAGHSTGPDSPAYLKAIKDADAQVGRILQAVRSRPSYAQENWLTMVTADHGHKTGGDHGGSDPRERSTFVIAQGADIPAGATRTDVRLVDLAATALKHLGQPLDPALDGRPITTASTDPFDTLRPSLAERADETGIPAGLKGFTHTPPTGWKVDNGAMGTGGYAEWRGWSFATDEFWTRTERDQRRETNVRSRDVFAVADSDEWTDKPVTGGFDSTLVGPPAKVYPGSTLDLSYVTHYRTDPAQKAEVSISFDGATPVPVTSYTADAVAKTESFKVQVPAGAKQAQVRFRYASTKEGWYWAVDDVRLSSKPAEGLVVSEAKTRSVAVGNPAHSPAWQAFVDLTVTDLAGKPVHGALVKGSWLREGKNVALPALCRTGDDGRCTLTRTVTHAETVKASINDIQHARLPYYPEGSEVTEVTVNRP